MVKEALDDSFPLFADARVTKLVLGSAESASPPRFTCTLKSLLELHLCCGPMRLMCVRRSCLLSFTHVTLTPCTLEGHVFGRQPLMRCHDVLVFRDIGRTRVFANKIDTNITYARFPHDFTVLPSAACSHSTCVFVIDLSTLGPQAHCGCTFSATSCHNGSSARVAWRWTCTSTFFNPYHPRRHLPACD